MDDVVFVGNHRDAALFRDAGILSYAPPPSHLAERVMAERGRCRVLVMTQSTLQALPVELARELREGAWPRLEIVQEGAQDHTASGLVHALRHLHPVGGEAALA